MSPLDEGRLDEAIALAHEAIGRSDPNPRVGCVIGHADGRVLGRGATQRAGQAHAEVMALRDAAAQGLDVRGATAWVSLEPCAHQGRTGPCCEALADAGIARVVVAVGDPNPLVAGRGIARLQARGLEVVPGLPRHAEAARELNIGFFSRHERGRPWVRLKVATSLDGRTALDDGRSQWLTGPEARADGHAWRRRAQAVLTGIGTVLADDPRLDVRLVPTELQPMRVVADTHWRLPPGARLLPPPGRVLVAGADGHAERRAALERAGAETLTLPAANGVDLPALIAELFRREVNELHVEAGAVLNGALLAAGCVDELLVYLAPKLVGPGRPLAVLPALPSLDQAAGFRSLGWQAVGADLRWQLRPTGPRDAMGRRKH